MTYYRVLTLTIDGEVPDEVGEIHYFSSSLERTEKWVKILLAGQEPPEYFPQILDIHNGYAVMEVEATDVREDRYFPNGEDFFGRIISSKEIRIVRGKRCLMESHTPKKWWRRFLG